MVFTVLTDEEVNSVAEGLNLDELDEFRKVLSQALHDFSTDPNIGGSYQQPHRVSTFHQSSEATTLYMPSTGPQGIGCKVVSLTTSPPKDPSLPSISPTGVVQLFDTSGRPEALLHATTLTAFRTALASSCLVSRRNHLRTITVFGSGLQAYWHVRLALKSRGSSIKTVNVVNRTFSDNAKGMLKKFALVDGAMKEQEGWTGTTFNLLTPAFREYDRILKDYIRSSDVIFCCTPSKTELFDASYLTNHEGRKRGRLIVAVGSYTPEMRELPEGLLLQATKSHDKSRRHFHKHADEGGVIVVDTLEGALKEAGEIISAKIGPNQLVELGELVMLKRQRMEELEQELASASLHSSSSERSSLELGSRTPSMATVFSSGEGSSHTGSSVRSSSPGGGGESGRKSPSSFHLPFRKSSKSSSTSSLEEKKREYSLCKWLTDGTVVYKSVGLGLMDLVVGTHTVEVAREKRLGTQIPGF